MIDNVLVRHHFILAELFNILNFYIYQTLFSVIIVFPLLQFIAILVIMDLFQYSFFKYFLGFIYIIFLKKKYY